MKAKELRGQILFTGRLLVLVALFSLATAWHAIAQPRLVSGPPAPGGSVPGAGPFVFTFSEAMNPDATFATFLDMQTFSEVSVNDSWTAGNTVLTCTPGDPIPAGRQIVWSVVGESAVGELLSDTPPPGGIFTTTGSGGGGSRIQAFDRLRARAETFANCGAVAGTLARMDEHRSPWQSGHDEELLLRPAVKPEFVLTDAERTRLAAHGINPLQSLRAASPRVLSLKTLAGGSAASADARLLTAQRRNLLLMAGIERGTRWAMFEQSERPVWQKLERQVQALLQPLAASGLFGAADEPDAFQVVSDERINSPEDIAAGRINLLVSLRVAQPGQWRSFMVTQSRAGGWVWAVRTNVLFSRKDAKLNTITIISGGAGEGKSTTLFNLAIVFAQNGQRLLLVDSDLRRPSLHKYLRVSNGIGLTSVLLKQNTLEEVIHTTSLASLDFLASGKL